MAKPRVNRYVGRTGFVDDPADAVDIRGAKGDDGQPGQSHPGGTLHAASQSEAETGTDNSKYMTALRVLQAIVHRVADWARTGNSDRIPKGKIPSDTVYGGDARLPPAPSTGTAGQVVKIGSGGALEYDDETAGGLNTNAVNRLITSAVFSAARTAVSTLTESVKKAFRDRIGAEKAGRVDYISQNLGTYNYFGSPRRDTAEDTGVSIPDGANRLLISPLNDGNYAELDVATLLALPNVNAGDTTSNTNSINLFDESDFRIAHNNRVIYFVNASVQGPRETADFVAHLPKLEPYADRATPDAKIPESRFGAGRLITDAERAKLDGIAAGAQVNVKPDWDAPAASPAGILNKPGLPPPPDIIPLSSVGNDTLVVVIEDGDPIIQLDQVDAAWFFGSGRGSVIDKRYLASNAILSTAIRGLRYTPTTREVEIWISQGHGFTMMFIGQDRAVEDAYSLDGTLNQAVPWSPSGPLKSYYRFNLDPEDAFNLASGRDQLRINLAGPGGAWSSPRRRYAASERTAPTESGDTLPTSPATGKRFFLLASQANVPDTIDVTPSTFGDGTLVSFPLAGVPADIDLLQYRNANTSPSGSAQRINVDVNTTVTSRTPSKITIDGTDYALAATGSGGYISPVVRENPLTAGGVHRVNVEFTNGTKWAADRTLTPGEFFWNGYSWKRI